MAQDRGGVLVLTTILKFKTCNLCCSKYIQEVDQAMETRDDAKHYKNTFMAHECERCRSTEIKAWAC